ncbi:MAG TPA: GNAT family N-acetyltransferase [Alphaproteobacteria bacterium]|nr:GNAT family N-acetyltransferase [Alphaproteobacteria bacterium]
MGVTIRAESPLQDEVRELVRQLNDHLLSLTPPEFCFHMTVEQMAEPGRAVGIGALRRESDGIAEVKRMFCLPEMRGQHVGSGILDRIIELAKSEGITRLVLETGDRHPEAWRLYESRGFVRCGPVLDYPDSPWSVFYEKALSEPAVA